MTGVLDETLLVIPGAGEVGQHGLHGSAESAHLVPSTGGDIDVQIAGRADLLGGLGRVSSGGE